MTATQTAPLTKFKEFACAAVLSFRMNPNPFSFIRCFQRFPLRPRAAENKLLEKIDKSRAPRLLPVAGARRKSGRNILIDSLYRIGGGNVNKKYKKFFG